LQRLLAVVITAGAAVVLAAPDSGAAEPSPREIDRLLAQASHRLEIVIEGYNELREDLRITQAQSRVLTKELAPLEEEIAARRGRVGLIAGSAYRAGGVAAVDTLLTAGSAAELVDRLLALDHLARQQRAALADLTAAHDRYAVALRTLDALVGQRQTQEGQLQQRKRQIESDISRLQRLRDRAVRAGYRPSRGGIRDTYVPPFSPGPAGVAVQFAYAQLGKPYRWGAEGPGGYDCSGLTRAAWATAGVLLPHNSRRQWAEVAHISRAQLRPGDLIFFYRDIHHVGIFIGGGRMIHAPTFGERVRINTVDHAPVRGYGRPA
jgi:cell wall-associated NlpC family hydrolase